MKYQKLVDDLQELYDLAKAGEFSDFSNKQFSAPKIELVKRLDNIIKKTVDGEYDG